MAGSLRMAWTSGSCLAAFLRDSGSSCPSHLRRPLLASFRGEHSLTHSHSHMHPHSLTHTVTCTHTHLLTQSHAPTLPYSHSHMHTHSLLTHMVTCTTRHVHSLIHSHTHRVEGKDVFSSSSIGTVVPLTSFLDRKTCPQWMDSCPLKSTLLLSSLVKECLTSERVSN